VRRAMWLTLGLLFVALGFIGAFLPLMPTTIFLILAVGCFARSSPRLETWLLSHPRFGGTLRAWREEGAMSSTAKIMACTGMTAGYALFLWGARPGLGPSAIVGAILASCAAFVLTRPQPRS